MYLPLVHVMLGVVQPHPHLYGIALSNPVENILHVCGLSLPITEKSLYPFTDVMLLPRLKMGSGPAQVLLEVGSLEPTTFFKELYVTSLPRLYGTAKMFPLIIHRKCINKTRSTCKLT